MFTPRARMHASMRNIELLPLRTITHYLTLTPNDIKGNGIVTRRPLVLQLYCVQSDLSQHMSPTNPNQKDNSSPGGPGTPINRSSSSKENSTNGMNIVTNGSSSNPG